MDELTKALEGNFQVTTYPNNPAAPHPRFASYKQRTPKSADQAVRRQKILDRQKEKRFDYHNLTRGLTDGDWFALEEDDEQEDEEENMELEVSVRKPGRYYKNQLMLSEWMIDKPDDFEENWVMVPCPVGKRSLIIAAKGITSVYARNGSKVNSFNSLIMGGNASTRQHHSILDAIYVEAENTYYVLDLMCWGNHPIYDSETEFRFYWLQTKLSETPLLSEIGHSNKYKIIALPNFACAKDNLARVLSSLTNIELDGLLFYHKAAHYLFGPTPLVLWLKAYMVPEILHLEVPQCLLDKKPHDYVCFSHHIDKVTAAQARRETQRQLAKRGHTSPGRRRSRGRGPSRGVGDGHLQTMEISPSSDAIPDGLVGVARGGPAGKGRGRGRGHGRGQGRSQGRGQYLVEGESVREQDTLMDECETDESMEVTSKGGGGRRRRNRHRHKKQNHGMDTSEIPSKPEELQGDPIEDT